MDMPATALPAIQVIDRASRLMDAVAAGDGPVALGDLARAAGLHPSTAHRILTALAQTGFVERAPLGRYSLGVKLRRLAGRVPHDTDIRDRARPILEELRDQTGETINLTVREGDEVVYVERALARRIMRVEQIIGSRAPLHVTAVGKIMLGDLGEAFLLEYARRSGLASYTGRTITTLTALSAEVERTLARGYALDDEEAEEGVGCIGVAVRDFTGRVVAGLSLSAPLERRQDDWVPLIQGAAARISARLGYQEPSPAAPPAPPR
jgi:DNA-binding IclR family transcriptional regulator